MTPWGPAVTNPATAVTVVSCDRGELCRGRACADGRGRSALGPACPWDVTAVTQCRPLCPAHAAAVALREPLLWARLVLPRRVGSNRERGRMERRREGGRDGGGRRGGRAARRCSPFSPGSVAPGAHPPVHLFGQARSTPRSLSLSPVLDAAPRSPSGRRVKRPGRSPELSRQRRPRAPLPPQSRGVAAAAGALAALPEGPALSLG